MPSHCLKLLRAALTASLVLVAMAGAVAAPFEDYLAVYNKGDYATALRLIRPLADKGNADAQYNLGVLYEKGQGVPQDYAEAMKWYRLRRTTPRR
jgi:TPR repeat protein